MEKVPRRVVVLVHAGKRAETLLGWLRQLMPAAGLLLMPPAFPAVPPASDEVLVVDAQDVDSPLSLADALARAQERAGQRGRSHLGQG